MFVFILTCFAVCDVALFAFSDIDLNGFTTGSVGYKMIGAVTSTSFGDFNGDGYGDIIIGASGQDMAYFVFGRSGNITVTIGMAVFTSSVTTGFKLLGAISGDAFGCMTGGFGGVNGDGYDDIIIGPVLVTFSGRTQTGAAYVIFGHSNTQVF